MALGAVFLANILLSFGFGLFIAGLFGAKFGQGRSRGIGFVLSLIALLIVGAFAALTWPLLPGVDPIFDDDLIATSIVAVTAALIGTAIAVVTFVGAVMKA